MPVPDPVETAIHTLSPQSTIDSLTNGPVKGFVTAIVDGQPLYVSNDGRFVLQGHMYDMARGTDLTARHLDAKRAELLRRIPASDAIVFAPTHPTHKVFVFVDTECGYCQRLVASTEAYLREGIELDFVAWPRAGSDSASFRRSVSIWCSRDRRNVLLAAFRIHEPAPAACESPVPEMVQLADAMELPGTPAILTPDGRLLGGFLLPSQLRRALDSPPR